MAYKVKKIDVGQLGVEETQALYAVDCSIVEKYNFLKQFRDVSDYKHSFLSTFLTGDHELFVIAHHSAICGMISFIKSADWSGKERYELTIRLCELVVSDSLLACLDQLVCEKLAQHGEFALITFNHELEALISKHTAKIDQNANTYTLDKVDIDLNMLNETIGECQAKNGDLEMIYTDLISEEYIQQYCDLFMETMVYMPDRKEEGYVRYVITPEKQRQKNEEWAKMNQAHHCYLIFDGDEMIGKTNLSVDNNDPRFPYQFMIGIKSEYRGRSLGKWLYASMYKRLAENVAFEKVLIHHHPENKHAIAISEWMGYKFKYVEVKHVLTS